MLAWSRSTEMLLTNFFCQRLVLWYFFSVGLLSRGSLPLEAIGDKDFFVLVEGFWCEASLPVLLHWLRPLALACQRRYTSAYAVTRGTRRLASKSKRNNWSSIESHMDGLHIKLMPNEIYTYIYRGSTFVTIYHCWWFFMYIARCGSTSSLGLQLSIFVRRSSYSCQLSLARRQYATKCPGPNATTPDRLKKL